MLAKQLQFQNMSLRTPPPSHTHPKEREGTGLVGKVRRRTQRPKAAEAKEELEIWTFPFTTFWEQG
jgi:hypothetical protein